MKSNINPVRVLVVADDSLARAGLATLIGSQPDCIVTGQIVSDGNLSDAAQIYRPDVIVWDLGTNPANALEHAANFRDARLPLIALLPDAASVAEAWSAGARGLLMRDTSAENLASAIATVAQGLAVIEPTLAVNLFPSREQTPAPPIEDLTPRELQVLRLMAEGQSNKTIAHELGISEHTVKFHVNAILGKLNVQSRTEAVVHATRLGLILL